MRGVVVFFSGLLVLTAITMFTGMVYEPIVDIVASDPTVQDQGLDSSADSITDVATRWLPLLYIAYLLVWAGGWYFRRNRVTAHR